MTEEDELTTLAEMSARDEERAAVVRYLREQAAAYNGCDPLEWRSAADAIERGDHLKR